jgi:hypothetical protein
MKKISNKNTKSDIDAELKSVERLFFVEKSIIFNYAGSFNISRNSVACASNL